MKYFTMDAWLAQQDPSMSAADIYAPLQAYTEYLDGIREVLPPDFQKMLATICIHDADLKELTVSLSTGHVTLRFMAGNLEMTEARHVRLVYSGGSELRCFADSGKGVAGPFGFGRLGNDEVEVVNGGHYEHRMVFSNGIELAIAFTAFTLHVLGP